MATYDRTNASAFPWDGKDRFFVVENLLDLTSSAITENDDYQLIDIPARTLVLGCQVDILTAATGTTCTIDVGYGGNGAGTVDDFGSNIDGKVVARTYTASATADGTYFDTADTIDVNFDVATAITAGPKLRVRAICIDLSGT